MNTSHEDNVTVVNSVQRYVNDEKRLKSYVLNIPPTVRFVLFKKQTFFYIILVRIYKFLPLFCNYVV